MARTASGLQCSHGSTLDERIPRAKLPKRALPDCLRRKIKGAVVDENAPQDDAAGGYVDIYSAGSGVLAPVGSAADGKFLKRGTGKAMSERASALAQQRGDGVGARATIRRPKLVDSGATALEGKRESEREFRARQADLAELGGGGGGGPVASKWGRDRKPAASGVPALPAIGGAKGSSGGAAAERSGDDPERAARKAAAKARKAQAARDEAALEQQRPPQQKQQQKQQPGQEPRRTATNNALAAALRAFLEQGVTPRLAEPPASPGAEVDEDAGGAAAAVAQKPKGKGQRPVASDLVPEALRILREVNRRYGAAAGAAQSQGGGKAAAGGTWDAPSQAAAAAAAAALPGDGPFLDAFLGPAITKDQAETFLVRYVDDLVGDRVELGWTSNSSSGGRFQETEGGTRLKVWVFEGATGCLRAHGVAGLAHREVATLGLRALNDKAQPWSSGDKGGLRLMGISRSGAVATGEGLGAIHFLLGCPLPQHRFLWESALLYYATAAAAGLDRDRGDRGGGGDGAAHDAGGRTFKELFAHLAPFCGDPARRFAVCAAARKGLADGRARGAASGAAQVAFEAAAAILQAVARDDDSAAGGGGDGGGGGGPQRLLDLRDLMLGKVDLGAVLGGGKVRAVAKKGAAGGVTLPRFVDAGPAAAGGADNAKGAAYARYLAEVRAIARLNGFAGATTTATTNVPHQKNGPFV